MYCPKIIPDFVESASCTFPNLTCTVRLILSHRNLVLSNICLVLSKICLVLSQFRLVRSQYSTYFDEKIIMNCPKIASYFVDSASRTVPISTGNVQKLSCYVPVVSSFLVSYCPNFNLSIPTIQLNKQKKSSCTVQKIT